MAGFPDRLLNSPDPRRTARWLLAAIFLFRALYLVPFTDAFDLAGDECYYWDWGRILDWGYYSKPPMIGWLMGAVGRLSGNSEWGIRLAALLLGTASLALLHQLARTLFGPRAAILALLLAALTPANAALNLFLTIDAPLVLCWTAALLVYWRLCTGPDHSARWLLLGVILGLGYLSKQMMLVFPILMILHAACHPPARPLLRRAPFWICIGGSLLFLAPVILWNAAHEWVTLKHTSHHFEAKPHADLGDHLGHFGTFLGLQALSFSPLTWLAMMAAVLGALWKWRVLQERERFLAMFSGPALLVFILLSFRQNINPNWPAVYYLGAAVLAAAWLDRSALDALPWTRLRGWATPVLAVGALATLAGHALPFLMGALDPAGRRQFDRAGDLRGWKEAGLRAGSLLREVPRPDRTFLLVLGYRTNPSRFAFYMPGQPRAFRFVHRNVIESQYELWPHPMDAGFGGGDAFILDPADENAAQNPALPISLTRQFDEVRELGEVRVPIGGGASRNFKAYLGRNLQFWRPPLRRDAPPPDADAAAQVPAPDAG